MSSARIEHDLKQKDARGDLVIGPLPGWLNALVAFGIVLLLHLPISVRLTPTLFLPVAGIPILSLVMLLYRPRLIWVSAVAVCAITFVGIVIALSDYQTVSLARRVFSGIQFPYILTFASIFVFARPLFPEEKTVWAKVFMTCAYGIGILGFLEIITPLKALSDSVREVLYSQGLYAADLRDLALAGHIRPKVFSSEPSQAAWTICQCVVCSLSFNRTGKYYVLGLGALAIAMGVFVSPAIVVIFALILLLYLLEQFAKRPSATEVAGIMAWVLLGFVMAGAASYFLFGERFLYKSIDELDLSVYLRVIQPFDLVRLALSENLLIGVGFGGLDEIWNKISYIEGGASVENINASAGIALLTIPTFSGLIGVGMFLVICVLIVRYLPGWEATQALSVLCIAMLQKQSFVITSVWILAGIWLWGLKAQRHRIDTRSKQGSDMRAVSDQRDYRS